MPAELSSISKREYYLLYCESPSFSCSRNLEKSTTLELLTRELFRCFPKLLLIELPIKESLPLCSSALAWMVAFFDWHLFYFWRFFCFSISLCWMYNSNFLFISATFLFKSVSAKYFLFLLGEGDEQGEADAEKQWFDGLFLWTLAHWQG